MEKKQTAVEWLIDNLPMVDANDPYWKNIINQAKEIHTQNLQHAFHAGWVRANALNYDPKYFDHYISEL